MTHRATTRFAATVCWLCLLASPAASAAALYFLPATDVTSVSTGDVLVLNVVADFTGEPTLGASFDVRWDDNALALTNFEYTLVGEPLFGREPDQVPGALELWSFGAFDGVSGVNTLGTLTFEVLAGMGPTTQLSFGCFSALEACRFISAQDFITEIPTDLIELEIARVPLPAALWLMLGGLLALPRQRAVL